jgi:hypothetical protein
MLRAVCGGAAGAAAAAAGATDTRLPRPRGIPLAGAGDGDLEGALRAPAAAPTEVFVWCAAAAAWSPEPLRFGMPCSWCTLPAPGAAAATSTAGAAPAPPAADAAADASAAAVSVVPDPAPDILLPARAFPSPPGGLAVRVTCSSPAVAPPPGRVAGVCVGDGCEASPSPRSCRLDMNARAAFAASSARLECGCCSCVECTAPRGRDETVLRALAWAEAAAPAPAPRRPLCAGADG